MLLAVAASSENYFAGWQSYQREYRRILLAKAENEAQVESARRFGVEIRQIVVPDLDRVDRCTSCHLGLDDPRMVDVPHPFKVHPGPFLEDHELESFGCTGCHLGQGRATSRQDAHAREEAAFWAQPLLPAPFTQSSCGVCHDPEHLGTRHAPSLAVGFDLFRSEGCLGCHKLGGRGGPLGPSLDRVGDKGRHALSFAHITGEKQVWNWHLEHFRAPATVVPDSQMPASDLEEAELEGLVSYMLSLRSSNLTERLTPRDRYEQRYQVWHTPPLSGEDLYLQFCFACHEEGTETLLHDSLEVAIPSIRNPDFLAVASREFLVQNIHRGRPTTTMPAWSAEAGGLTDEEILRIADYLLEARQEVREVAFTPAASADANAGEALFAEECADCHALTREESEASWLGDPEFQAVYDDALMGHTIKWGRVDTLMIGYGEEADGSLTDQQISDLVAFIRTIG